MALTTKQHDFIRTFVIGVGAGVVTNIIMHFLTRKEPTHPKPELREVPPPGAE